MSEESSGTSVTEAAFEDSVRRHVKYSLGKAFDDASIRDLYWAVSLTVKDLLVEGMLETRLRYRKADAKRLYYLSAEFLMGRSLSSNLCNLGLYDTFIQSLRRMGTDPDDIEECEFDAALGNGGLGRLAACFLDSLATLDMPG